MKCQKCGYSLPEDSEFCQYCGAHLEPQPASDIISDEAATPEEAIAVAAPEVIVPESEAVSEPIVIEPSQPETVQEESIFRRAYSSFLSDDPEERRFFEEVLGSEALKAAYMEECDRNQQEYDRGVRVNFKQSYTDFMHVLHDTYSGTPPVSPTPPSSEITEEAPKTVIAPTVQATAPAPTAVPVSQNDKKSAFCKKCGSAIDPNTKKCSGCGKQYFNAQKTVPIVLLSVLLITSIGLNILQYLQGQAAIETVATQTTQIEKLEKEVSTQKSTISSQKSTISSQKNQIAALEEKGGYFDTICKELSTGNIGYAASNFRASESVIVVDKNETNRKFTLTANWTNGGTVSTDYSGYSAWVDFDNDSWTTSTKMTIEPWSEGVTTVTFSNDVDSKTFKVIIIVT
ncbi:zinc ribbon domain-containing protein [Intestinimonas butyriciproducens]|uniref:zinc ribbon domain-containing protein n=1 Tax=Intestinimonas butyriciproducens TaxID=1297617 RepID=UPI00321AFD25